MARVLAIVFPDILIEQAKAQKSRTHSLEQPWVVVLKKEGTQRKSLSSYTRINATSGVARKAGIVPGHTLASARAKVGSLGVTILTEAHLKTELTRIAELAMVFAPGVAFETQRSLVWVQISDCAHLHRHAADSSGERTLATQLAGLFVPAQYRFRMAIADGPRLAAATVLHSPNDQMIQVAPHGKSAEAFGQLPVEAWEVTDATQQWLINLGCSKIEHVQKLPSLELRSRLNEEECGLLPLLEGRDESVLEPYHPVTWPEETVSFDDDLIHSEALLFAAKRMVQSLSTRLSARALGATKVKASLFLHRILAGEAPRHIWELTFPTPTYRFDALFTVIRASIERVTLDAPATALTLAVVEAVPLPTRALDLFLSEAKTERLLPQWWAECAAALGPENVGTLEVVDTWHPELRTKLVPWSSSTGSLPAPKVSATRVPEPVRWLKPPIRFDGPVTQEPVMLRAHSVEWWTNQDTFRQWRLVWIPWAHASAWVEEGDGQYWIRGWVDA